MSGCDTASCTNVLAMLAEAAEVFLCFFYESACLVYERQLHPNLSPRLGLALGDAAALKGSS